MAFLIEHDGFYDKRLQRDVLPTNGRGVMQNTQAEAEEYAARFTRVNGAPCRIVPLTREQYLAEVRRRLGPTAARLGL